MSRFHLSPVWMFVIATLLASMMPWMSNGVSAAPSPTETIIATDTPGETVTPTASTTSTASATPSLSVISHIVPDSEFTFLSAYNTPQNFVISSKQTSLQTSNYQYIYDVSATTMVNPLVLLSIIDVLKNNSLGIDFTQQRYLSRISGYISDCHQDNAHSGSNEKLQDCSSDKTDDIFSSQVDLIANALEVEYQNQYIRESNKELQIFTGQYVNRASNVIEKVLYDITNSNQLVQTLGNEINHKFYKLLNSTQSITRAKTSSAIQVNRSALSSADQIALLNSQLLQLPWKMGTSQCTTGWLHGFYDKDTTNFQSIGESLDYGSCSTWEWGDINDKFDVYTMLDGAVTFQPTGLCRLDITKTVNFNGTARSITIVYLHLDLPVGFNKTTFGRNEKIASIAMNASKATCGATGWYTSTAPHLHVTVLIDGVKVFFSKDQPTYPVKGWNVGGWTHVVNASLSQAYQQNSFCFIPISESINCNTNTNARGKSNSDSSQAILNKQLSIIPILTTPADGETTNDGLWPTLSWTSASNGPFELRVSRNSNFSDCVVCQTVTGTSYLPSGSNASAWMRERTGTFYWRVRVANGQWSTSRSFQNQNTVVTNLQAPADGYTTTDGLWPTLSWSAASIGPFELRISQNANFSDCVVCQTISGTSYRPSGSGAETWMRARTGTFYWRVRVASGQWSTPRSFQNTVATNLQAPNDGHTTTNGLWPTLSWTSASNGPFELRVSQNANFSDCVVCQTISGTSYRPSGSGAETWMRARTGTFYWRVRVNNGIWSSPRTFRNTNVPLLQAPSDGHTTNDGLWPTLSWSSASNGPFEIYVSQTSNFSDCVVCENVSGYSYRPTGSGATQFMRERIGTFYWRVRVVGGEWSSVRTFVNKPPAYSNDFGSNANGWRPIRGSWYNGSGYLYGSGSVNTFNSISFDSALYADVDYSVTIYRDGGISSPNVIYVRGDRSPDSGKNNIWKNAVYLLISQNGGVSYGQNVENTSGWHSGWLNTGRVNTNNWNTLRIIAIGSSYQFYVNGYKVGEFSNSTHKKGYVGAALYSSSAYTPGTMYIDSFSVSPR